MRKERKHFTPEEKVAILRRHLADKVPVSELCEELRLRPTMFYRWQKELFENGAAAFQSQGRPHRQVEENRRASLTMPAKPPKVPQIVEQDIAAKGIKQAHQHQHDL
jgi:transposase-like protein